MGDEGVILAQGRVLGCLYILGVLSCILQGQCPENGHPEAVTHCCPIHCSSGWGGAGGEEKQGTQGSGAASPGASPISPCLASPSLPSSNWMMPLPASSRPFTQAHACPLLTAQLKASLGSLGSPSTFHHRVRLMELLRRNSSSPLPGSLP